jgi:hypothetical protein
MPEDSLVGRETYAMRNRGYGAGVYSRPIKVDCPGVAGRIGAEGVGRRTGFDPDPELYGKRIELRFLLSHRNA